LVSALVLAASFAALSILESLDSRQFSHEMIKESFWHYSGVPFLVYHCDA